MDSRSVFFYPDPDQQSFCELIVPVVGISSPVSILNVVVFPAPLIPRRPKHSPVFTPKLSPRTAVSLQYKVLQSKKYPIGMETQAEFGLASEMDFFEIQSIFFFCLVLHKYCTYRI